jgi:predicted ATP-grasp superfamily ATP-dependent carboligase
MMSIASPPRPSASGTGVVVLGSDFKALGVIRSLGRRGIPCVVVDNVPRSAWFSRYVSRRFLWKGSMWGPSFLDFLLSIAERHGFDGWILFPVQDEVVELFARNRERLAGTYRVITQDWDLLRWAHDKRLLYRVAAEVGVGYPRTWYPSNDRDVRQLVIDYPAIIKPAISIRMQYATGRKAFLARDPSELLAQYRRAAIVADDLMVQEMIPGNGTTQFSVAAFCTEGSITAAMTARRTRQYPADFGLSSSFVEALDVPELMEPTQRLIRRLRLSGMVEVEFKFDHRDGRYKLLDVNIRPWAWHALCIACGLDFPYLQYCEAVGEPAPAMVVHYGYRWRRFLTDVPAIMQAIRSGMSTPAACVRSLRGPTVSSVFDRQDPIPAIGDLAVALARLMQPRRGRLPVPTDAGVGPYSATDPVDVG